MNSIVRELKYNLHLKQIYTQLMGELLIHGYKKIFQGIQNDESKCGDISMRHRYDHDYDYLKNHEKILVIVTYELCDGIVISF